MQSALSKITRLGIVFLWVSSLISYFSLVRSEYVAGRPHVSVLYVSVLAVAAVLFLLTARRQPAPSPPTSKEFFPIGKTTEGKVWSRRSETEELCTKIAGKPSGILLVVGASGAGKTILLRDFVLSKLQRNGWATLRIPASPYLTEKYASKIEEFNTPGQPGVVLVDQFERFPTAPELIDAHEVNENERFAREIGRTIRNDELRHVVVIRKEALHDVGTYFSSYGIPVHDSTTVGGISRSVDSDSWQALHDSFCKISQTCIPSRDTIEGFFNRLFPEKQILPVEAQIVGWTLEAIMVPNAQETRRVDELLTKDKSDIVDTYLSFHFESYRDRGDPATPLRVLLALSFQRPAGRSLSLLEISEVCHQKTTDIGDCIKFYADADRGLVKDVEVGKYELAHDYIAEQIRRYSATQMDPIERDNILHFSDLLKDRPAHGICPRTNVNKPTAITVSKTLFALVITFLTTRLFAPTIPGGMDLFSMLSLGSFAESRVFSASAQGTAGMKLLDVYFLPIYMAALFGLLYEVGLNSNFLIFLREKGGKYLTFLITVVSYACGLSVVFFPEFWLAACATPVIVFSLKLFQIGLIKGHSSITRKAIVEFAALALSSSIAILCIGLYLAFFVYSPNPDAESINNLRILNFVLAIVMMYYYYVGYYSRVSKATAIRFLGLLDRGQRS